VGWGNTGGGHHIQMLKSIHVTFFCISYYVRDGESLPMTFFDGIFVASDESISSGSQTSKMKVRGTK
jgi:hypothetical protein